MDEWTFAIPYTMDLVHAARQDGDGSIVTACGQRGDPIDNYIRLDVLETTCAACLRAMGKPTRNLPPTTAEERARLLDGMQAAGPHLTLTDTTMLQRLCADIDRLESALDASDAGAAALRRTLEY